MPRETNPDRDPKLPTSPYGPQRGQVDEAAGGADSSPYEATPSGEQSDEAERPQEQGRQQAADPDRPAG